MKYVKKYLLPLLCMLIPISANADGACSIIYGSNWAFMINTPDKWNSDCDAEKHPGITAVLWPDNSTFRDSPGVMYVNVSQKDKFTLEQFADDEIARFREESPKLTVKRFDPILFNQTSVALVNELTNDQFGNHELVAYADAGSVFLIFVLTSRNDEFFAQSKQSFNELVSSMIPMQIKFGPETQTNK